MQNILAVVTDEALVVPTDEAFITRHYSIYLYYVSVWQPVYKLNYGHSQITGLKTSFGKDYQMQS